ncbi:MAG: hypothetical protein EBZ69_01645 [Alphaproteobacteria bacterium]|nr:hypothetical protein [Alphaproteobacteria bacterium]
MDAKVALLQKLKALASNLGRVPTRDEFRDEHGEAYSRHFGGFTPFLHAAGLEPNKKAKPEKFKWNRKQIESFKVHELDLGDLFEKHGNPEILRITAQPDTHMKHRDHRAVGAMMSFLDHYSPHLHIIGGDLLDADGISHWPQNDLQPRSFIPEVVEARKHLDALKSKLCASGDILYIEGNHEDWIRQAMVAKMPEFFFGLEELGLLPDLSSLLELEARGIPLIPVNQILKIGKLHFTHGLFTGPHTHDVLTHHEPSMNGQIEAASLGCLCRLDAPFLKGRPNNWVHAFGIFEIRRDGSFSFYCPKIFNGQFSFGGKVFKG